MATLYVENVPDDVYQALKDRARTKRNSLSSEVIQLLQTHVPTAKQLEERKRILRSALKMRSAEPLRKGRFPSTEEMVREDRAR